MALRKLTLAAAISIGMISVAVPATMAADEIDEQISQDAVVAQGESAELAQAACPTCPTFRQPSSIQGLQKYQLKQKMTGAACPVCPQPCPENAAPACAKPLPIVTGPACPVCPDPCDPCDVSPACPVCPEPCDPCAEPDPCDPCDVSPACPVCPDQCADPCDPCPKCCPEPSKICPNVSKDAKMDELQVYAYPSSIFGRSQAYGTSVNSLSFGDYTGTSVARNLDTAGYSQQVASQFGVPLVPYGQAITGAATQLPCPCDGSMLMKDRTGTSVSRNPNEMAGATDPIEIQTENYMDVMKIVDVPVEITGPACPCPQESGFSDVPDDFWANCDIGKLVMKNVIAGYPDRTFKPNLPVKRSEFASMIVSGLNLENQNPISGQIYKDVPTLHWANNDIDKASKTGIMTGYPDNTFKPGQAVKRVEVLATLAKSLCGELNECDADTILSQYADGANVPGWAKLSVAQALQAGALENTPSGNMILPNQDASRAEVASMLSKVRVALGIDQPTVAALPTGAAATIKEEQIISLPTLNVKLDDEITARASHVGDKFAATTQDEITVNGTTFPAGSRVNGKIVEIIRPDTKTSGAMKIAFTDVSNGTMNEQLPRQILTAQVQQEKIPNPVARTVQAPFVWTGRLLGDIGRTVGGSVVIAGNAVEEVTNGVGIAGSEIFQGEFRGAARSIGGSVVALVKAPVDVARTALAGTAGLFSITQDEIAYLVNPKGKPIASVNPNETLTVAFGCQ